MNQNAWAGARNVLCVRLDYLGDVLMCTPAIRAVKSSGVPTGDTRHAEFDDARVTNNRRRVTLLTSGSGAAAARFVPEIDDTLVYDAPWLKSSMPHAVECDLALINILRRHQFDAAIIFTTYSQSALPAAMLCYLAGIPLRLAHCRENPYQMLTDWIPDPEPHCQVRHEVQRQLDLVRSIGCTTVNERLSFAVPERDLTWGRQRLDALKIAPDQPWLLLHPGATAASRRYPARHWVEVVRQLTDDFGYPVMLTGSAEEAGLIAAIAPSLHPLIHLEAGTLELGQLGALIALASVVICNNTGPAHISAAVGTPVVDLYALTNPQHAPWQVESRVLFHDVPCRNCYKSVCPLGHHDCLEKVQPGEVVEAARQLLGTASAFSFGDLSVTGIPAVVRLSPI